MNMKFQYNHCESKATVEALMQALKKHHQVSGTYFFLVIMLPNIPTNYTFLELSGQTFKVKHIYGYQKIGLTRPS